MTKVKLDTQHLIKGMYVCELDRPWSETSFLFQGFRITNEQEIESLNNSCEFVFVDEEKSTIEIKPDLLMSQRKTNHKKYKTPKPLHNIEIKHLSHQEKFEDEFPQAKITYDYAAREVNDAFENLRAGNLLDILSVKSSVQKMTKSVLRNPDALKLMCVLKNRNDNAVTHALHVCILTLAFANYLGLKKDMVQHLGIAALLHDVGEVQLPQDLFWKSEPFTKEEKEHIKKHTEFGVDIVSDVKGLHPIVLDVVSNHHERLNCSGFPRHACGDEISYNAMLVSIVDVYDSVTMGYEGKVKISCTEALKSMYDWRDDLFLGDLIEHFIQCLGIYPIGSVVKLNSGEIGIVVTFDDYSRLAPRVMLLLDNERNYYPIPRMLDLSLFKDSDEKYLYEIKQVVDPDEYGIDIRHHILNDLYNNNAVQQ